MEFHSLVNSNTVKTSGAEFIREGGTPNKSWIIGQNALKEHLSRGKKTSDSQATPATALVKDGFAAVVYTSFLEINTYCMEVMGQTYASAFRIQRVLNNLWPY